MCARRQAEILHSAAQLVRPGGRLVYSTCTFAPEEDEMAVAAFLDSHPEFRPETLEAPWFVPVENGGHRMWPHKLLGEGHFAAVLRKADADVDEVPLIKGEKLPKEWLSFAKELNISLPEGKAVSFGQNLYWVPTDMPDLQRLKVLRPGLELGTVKKTVSSLPTPWPCGCVGANGYSDMPRILKKWPVTSMVTWYPPPKRAGAWSALMTIPSAGVRVTAMY